jgi:hypothetical protein
LDVFARLQYLRGKYDGKFTKDYGETVTVVQQKTGNKPLYCRDMAGKLLEITVEVQYWRLLATPSRSGCTGDRLWNIPNTDMYLFRKDFFHK